MANRQDVFEIEGEVTEALPNTMFRVGVTTGPEDMIGKQVLCTLAGKMRMYKIRVMPGDHVKADISLIDRSRGRITFRVK